MGINITLEDAKPMFLMLKAKADAANAIHARYVLATSGKDEAVASFLATSDDEKVLKFREYESQIRAMIEKAKADLENAQEGMREYALANVNVDSDIDPDAESKKFLDARKEAFAATKALVTFVGEDLYKEGIEKFAITEVQSLRKGGKTTGATGVKRPRIESATVNGETLDKATFTEIAKRTNVSLDDFRTAAFKAADTEDIMSLPEGTVVSLSVTDKDGKSYDVTFTPKSRGVETEGNDSETEDSDSEE